MCSDGQSSVVIVDEGKSQRQSINDKVSLQNMETTADESGYNTNFSSKIQNPFGLQSTEPWESESESRMRPSRGTASSQSKLRSSNRQSMEALNEYTNSSAIIRVSDMLNPITETDNPLF